MKGEAMSILVRHAMTGSLQTARPDMTAADAAGLMRKHDIGVVPVVDEGRLIGLVTDRDLVVRVMGQRRDPDDVELAAIVTKSPITVSPDMRLSEARNLMAEMRIRRLPVVKGEELVGILSLGDVAVADASSRAVGDALEEISRSDSTMEMNQRPDRGTPGRVA
jgi:CBS domain-containing protein